MYHSVYFKSESGQTKNSYTDWHLVPNGRPTITMPSVKTTYVDIPGASGKLDLSETLTHYPLYDNRTGTLDFIVKNDYQTSDTSWVTLCHNIAKFTHGRRIKLILEDDQNHYYEGRVNFNWESGNDGGWSTVSFDYDLDPYKYWVYPLYHTKDSSTAGARWSLGDILELGSMPTVPTFEVSNVGASGISIEVTNEELGINRRTRQISTGGTYTFYDLILSNISGDNTAEVYVTGSGYVRMSYKMGDL